ncbi:endonuclease/exonuclease/phosphatase family protein [Paenibacillus sp. LHD-38]|uniref:endonuclease/exonuclease/phosphatase family protein n=1 Tax=Paenibacillus sp. LHD-38 TaxID=3072143 RepID=UPI00280EFD0A|nr:endonuclease/exonuclease/phosphatase family protein [Paenibacillus sp. LHD-38]MDQ8734499.1 endonuclease/exonuclease/phosphatase family protein [Paenibacillus sp. LHD-38]
MNTVDKVTLMTLNTWHGGMKVNDGMNKLVKAVQLSGADIVGIQEVPDPGKEIADKLGWYCYQRQAPLSGYLDCSVISKYPIVEAFDIEGVSAVAVVIILLSGQKILVADTHLHYDPYGPYWACIDEKPVADIIAMEEEKRGAEIALILDAIKPFLDSGMPVFLMGDFNAPSHLDWGADMKHRHNGYTVEWPISKKAELAGMIDSYRAVHPDPAVSPGFTWSPVHTESHPWGTNPREPQDRIDFIYGKGYEKVIQSEVFIIGSPQGFGSHEDNEWPTDHGAVVSTFTI